MGKNRTRDHARFAERDPWTRGKSRAQGSAHAGKKQHPLGRTFCFHLVAMGTTARVDTSPDPLLLAPDMMGSPYTRHDGTWAVAGQHTRYP